MPERLRFPEVVQPSGPPNDLPTVTYYAPIPPAQVSVSDEPTVPLSHYLWILRTHRWKMVAFVSTCLLATAVVSARLQPIYESTATIDIDRRAPSEVVGQDSARDAAPNDADQFLATQIKMIQSDAVLRGVTENFHLLDREGQLKRMSPEKMQEAVRAPITLRRLSVTRPPNTYLLLISYRSPDPQLAAEVANAIANSYLAHTYEIRIRSSAGLSSFMERQIDELKAKMERSSLALAQFEKDLDVINPEEKTNILSARLIQLNTEYTNAQAERVKKEAAWNGIKAGSLEAVQVSTQAESLAKLNDNLNQARQHFALVKSTFGTTHPEYRKAAAELAELQRQFEEARTNIAERVAVEYREALNREQMLQKSVADTKAEWDGLNSKSFQYQQLKREADADKNLYDELIRKIREADINVGFQNNNIRIADQARPAMHPVFPNLKLNLLLAFLFSTLLALGAALLQDTLDTTLRDPNEASRFLGADVIAAMPKDRISAQLPRNITAVESAKLHQAPLPSSGARHIDGYSRVGFEFDEAVRTLRNTILLSDFEGRLRSIVITSSVASEGKSTISAHLAIANADRGKRTLLVDGDLRRPSLHTKFGLSLRLGLSNVLAGEMLWQELVRPVEGRPNLSLLPAGPSSHRAADLIGPRLATLLDEFSQEYDLVILDSPPLLGFAESLQMATAADGVLIVSLAGETKRKAVALAISALKRLRANVIGVVLNQMSHSTSADGYSYYGYYQARYSERADG
jgi:succinoglycan biosynthesis transport protein ExoP